MYGQCSSWMKSPGPNALKWTLSMLVISRGQGLCIGIELVTDKESRKPASEAAELLTYKWVFVFPPFHTWESLISFIHMSDKSPNVTVNLFWMGLPVILPLLFAFISNFYRWNCSFLSPHYQFHQSCSLDSVSSQELRQDPWTLCT